MRCTSCGKNKDESEFRKNKNFKSRNGLSYQCKQCDLTSKRTPEGHMEKIYHSLKYNNQQRKLGVVGFTKAEFFKWCGDNRFDSLYQAWKRADWKQALAPSVDRKVDSKPYAFDNMVLTTWGANHSDNSTAMSRAVEQLEKGKVVKVFGSIREAGRSFSAKSTGSGIMYALGDEKRSAYGFQWRYQSKKR